MRNQSNSEKIITYTSPLALPRSLSSSSLNTIGGKGAAAATVSVALNNRNSVAVAAAVNHRVLNRRARVAAMEGAAGGAGNRRARIAAMVSANHTNAVTTADANVLDMASYLEFVNFIRDQAAVYRRFEQAEPSTRLNANYDSLSLCNSYLNHDINIAPRYIDHAINAILDTEKVEIKSEILKEAVLRVLAIIDEEYPMDVKTSDIIDLIETCDNLLQNMLAARSIIRTPAPLNAQSKITVLTIYPIVYETFVKAKLQLVHLIKIYRGERRVGIKDTPENNPYHYILRNSRNIMKLLLIIRPYIDFDLGAKQVAQYIDANDNKIGSTYYNLYDYDWLFTLPPLKIEGPLIPESMLNMYRMLSGEKNRTTKAFFMLPEDEPPSGIVKAFMAGAYKTRRHKNKKRRTIRK